VVGADPPDEHESEMEMAATSVNAGIFFFLLFFGSTLFHAGLRNFQKLSTVGSP
jgi:hypothetical protein